MAQAGTTPQGTEPQSGSTDDGTQPVGSGGGDGGRDNYSSQPTRKIAGKFNSLEEAVEQGYVGLEQGFHQLSENVSKLARYIEAAMDPSDGVPVGRGMRSGPDPYGRGQPQDDEIDPKDFILNPGQYLKARDDRLLNMVGRAVSEAVSNAQVVNEFKSENRDLLRHEHLVKGFLQQLDPRRPLAERLADAGKQARAYLAQVRAEATGTSARPPSGSEYVEPHRGDFRGSGGMGGSAGGGGGFPPSSPPLSPSQEEQELLDYINERHSRYASHFGPVDEGNK